MSEETYNSCIKFLQELKENTSDDVVIRIEVVSEAEIKEEDAKQNEIAQILEDIEKGKYCEYLTN